MKKLLLTAAVMAAILSISGLAYSAPLFEELDEDKNGFISKDEAKKMKGLSGVFAVMDKNEDGKLSRKEYNYLHPELQQSATNKAHGKK